MILTLESFMQNSLFKKCLDNTFDVGIKIKSFLSTGNLISYSGLDLMQVIKK